jgi:hypothetical protein
MLAAPVLAAPGNTVTVSWTLIPQQYQSFSSKIGLFQYNNASSPQYAQMTMSQCAVPAGNLATGSCQFPLSRTLPAGDYEFRYYGYNSTTGYRLVVTSGAITFAPPTPTASRTPTPTVVPTCAPTAIASPTANGTATPSPTSTPIGC